MKNWIDAPVIPVPVELQNLVGGHPLVAEVMARRGILTAGRGQGFLYPEHYKASAPDEMPGVALAADLLGRAIEKQELICVWGDFDVDGQTSTALLTMMIQELGGRVMSHVPVREFESHGVNLPVLKEILDQYSPMLLLTCDTGITSHAALEFARERGVQVVLSDHHELPGQLPSADVIVTPRFLPPDHPLASLPGVGVAYKLAEKVYENFGKVSQIEKYQDLAAIGIVADLAGLVGEARFLVQRGLDHLNKWQRPGLAAIIELAGIVPENITEEQIGFVLGPRLNALGRLGDANQGVTLLTTDDQRVARMLAVQMEGMNSQRQFLTEQVYRGALGLLEREPEINKLPILVLGHPEWPAGVLGIAASRLVQRLHKPVVLLATPPGALGRGSARSVAGFDITAALASQAPILANYGGHPMAAGLAIDADQIDSFRRGLGRVAHMMGVPSEVGLVIDRTLPIHEMSLDLVIDLERLAPFGQGNPGLVFCSPRMHVESQTWVGRDEEHLALEVADEAGNRRRVMWWQAADEPKPEGVFDLAYAARPNTYRGERDLSFTWIDYRPSVEYIEIAPRRQRIVKDHRSERQQLGLLHQLCSLNDVQVWAEGEAVERLVGMGIKARSRLGLDLAQELAIWTSPPDPLTVQNVLEKVNPTIIHLFVIDPGQESDSSDRGDNLSIEKQAELLLRRLAGLVKYAVKNNKSIQIIQFAALTAQAENAVSTGLSWLVEKGLLRIATDENGQLWVKEGPGGEPGRADKVLQELKGILAEVQAYRSYFHEAEVENLF